MESHVSSDMSCLWRIRQRSCRSGTRYQVSVNAPYQHQKPALINPEGRFQEGVAHILAATSADAYI
jgi:hypothetical protein